MFAAPMTDPIVPAPFIPSRPDPVGRRARARPYMLLAVFAFVFGGALAVAAAYGMYDEVRILRWQPATAEILVSRVTMDTVGLAVTEYGTRPVREQRLHVLYAFTGGSVEVRGTTIALHATHRSAEADAQRYRVGSRVNVYYDPRDPTHAVLERTVPKFAATGLAVGVLLLLTALWAYRRQRAIQHPVTRRSDPAFARVENIVDLKIPVRT